MAAKPNTLLTVASLCMKLSRRCLSRYSHPKSPQKFTQSQLMTCLVPRAYLKTTYRGVIEILETSGQLRKRLGLDRLPHYSTLKRFADRAVVPEVIEAILTQILQEVDFPTDEIAIDSTGLETTSASAHY